MYKNQIKIFLFTWALNMFVVTLVGFFPKFQTFLNLRGLFNILVIIYLWKNVSLKDRAAQTILGFSIYLFILSLFSSDIFLSLTMTVKAAIGMLTYIIAYELFSTRRNFIKLLNYYKYLFIILFLSIVFSNISGIGEVDYIEDVKNESVILFGGLGVSITKLLIIPILLAPVYLYLLKDVKRKQLVIFMIFVGIVVSILSGKRSSIMGLMGGALVYALLMEKTKILKPVVYMAVLGFISFPLYQDYVFSIFENRKSQLYYVSDDAGSMEKEGRYWETLEVLEAMEKDNTFHMIFGSELFNEFDYFDTKRMIHIDYNVILNGSGFLGLFLFLLIFFQIIHKASYFYRKAHDPFYKLIAISVISITVFGMLISIGGSVRSFDFRGPIFIYLGAAMGFLNQQRRQTSPTMHKDSETISEPLKQLKN